MAKKKINKESDSKKEDKLKVSASFEDLIKLTVTKTKKIDKK
jgi:hypothetical protein